MTTHACRYRGPCLALALHVTFSALCGAQIQFGIGEVEPEEGDRVEIVVPEPGPRGRDPAGAPGSDHLLRFLNGDVMHGRLISAEAGKLLNWMNPHAAAPIAFDLRNVAEIVLGGEGDNGAAAATLSRVRLSNGDQLVGEIVEMTAKELVLDTGYAGRITIRRPVMAAIYPNISKTTHVYEGPARAEDWVVKAPGQSAQVDFKKKAFYVTGHGATIGRNLDLPDVALIEWELGWRVQPQLYIYLYTDNIRGYNCNAYALRMESQRFYLYHQTRQTGTHHLGNAEVEGLIAKGKARIAVMVDRPKKQISLKVDGVLVKQWTDTQDFAGLGRGLMFHARSAGEMRISDIRVSKWDGSLGASPVMEDEAEQDRIRFVNEDRVSGEMKGIRRGKITFETDYAPLTVPLDRVVVVLLKSDGRELARRNAGDIRAHFRHGGRVTLDMRGLENGVLSGESENFGKADFQLGAFRRLSVNVYREGGEESALGGDW
ncbi:MAG: hypothetical protein JXR37_06690 [Kiritimatiellae bacterium]|nr:hypothetical protein [Kiritimatiellia bacterium]